MEPPKRRPHEPSGIPRLSKLPIPRSAASTISQRTFSGSLSQRPAATSKKQQHENQPCQQTYGESLGNLQDHGKAGEPAAGSREIKKEEDSPSRIHLTRRRPRPSLSDRTMETLAQLPPSPSPRRRKSSFFQTESPMTSPLRPASSMSRARPSTSMGTRPPLPGSRPSTSMGIRPPLPDGKTSLKASSPEKRRLAPITGNHVPQRTPVKAKMGSYVPRSLPRPGTRVSDAVTLTPSQPKPSLTDPHSENHEPAIDTMIRTEIPKPATEAKSLRAMVPKPRPSVQRAFEKAEAAAPAQVTTTTPGRPTQTSVKMSSIGSRTSSNPSNSLKKHSKMRAEVASPSPPKKAPQKSSASLREAIAKAKAERQAAVEARSRGSKTTLNQEEGFADTDLATSNKGLLRKRIQMARTDGRLNIAAMGLTQIPSEVMSMYDAEALDTNDGAWYESVDLVRLNAADNIIESLGDAVFPDDNESGKYDPDEDFQGNIFGGLETLDLHGNRLNRLPLGICRLQHLAILNISKNRLNNDCLAIIGHINSLRELRLAENAIEGALNSRILELQGLEILDLSNNKLSALPQSLAQLKNLRTLILAGNRIASLPSESLVSTALAVLDISQNRLRGVLMSTRAVMVNLKSLDVSHNALNFITNDLLAMQSLQTLNVAENCLEALPDLSSCQSLITLSASGNRITATPKGLVSLKQLKNVDLSRNDLKRIDEDFGLLDNLTVLRVANNPLRDRRFLTLNTEELKRELRVRFAPAEHDDADQHDGSPFNNAYESNGSAASKNWLIKPGGILDCSSMNVALIEPSNLEPLIEVDDIKAVILRNNNLTQIPTPLALLTSTLTSLDISHNKLSGLTYLEFDLELRNLRSLDISQNTITSFTPLFEHLDAPNLTELNVSRNRLSNLPPLRIAFPQLTSILAANNGVVELKVESVQGLESLDISGNEIDHLEPKLGLLGTEGLRTLLVGANKFRVPRRDVIEKGTVAILAWLRGRIPESQTKL